ncbi:MAG: pilus assembly protein [Alphaproteobacteria bacterium]|nr:pilus assembly protein [Alphaproteobacteria bacterium]
MIKKIARLVRSYKSEESGATAVEFGLVALPFLMAILGIMEAGRILWVMNSVEYALSDTARYASLNRGLGDGDFTVYAQGVLGDMMVPQAGTFQLITQLKTVNDIDFIQMDASYEVSTLFSGILPIANFNMSSSVTRPLIE